jgi:predicted HTH transcriptional regulator
MERTDRIHACYLHACLRYVQKEPMTNFTLRERFGIDVKNSAIVSRIIKDTVNAGLIVVHDETVGPRSIRYLPKWSVSLS